MQNDRKRRGLQKRDEGKQRSLEKKNKYSGAFGIAVPFDRNAQWLWFY